MTATVPLILSITDIISFQVKLTFEWTSVSITESACKRGFCGPPVDTVGPQKPLPYVEELSIEIIFYILA